MLLLGVVDKSIERDRTDQVRGDALEFFLFRPAIIWGRTNGSDFGLVIRSVLMIFAYFSGMNNIIIIERTHRYAYFVEMSNFQR